MSPDFRAVRLQHAGPHALPVVVRASHLGPLDRVGTKEAARTSMRHLYECLVRQAGATDQLSEVYRSTGDPNIAHLSGHLLAAVYTEWDLSFDQARAVLTSVDRWAHTFETVELLSVMDEGGVEFDI